RKPFQPLLAPGAGCQGPTGCPTTGGNGLGAEQGLAASVHLEGAERGIGTYRGLHLTRIGPTDIVEDGAGLLGGEHPEVDRVPPDGVAGWTPVLQGVPLLPGQREPGLHVMDREGPPGVDTVHLLGLEQFDRSPEVDDTCAFLVT